MAFRLLTVVEQFTLFTGGGGALSEGEDPSRVVSHQVLGVPRSIFVSVYVHFEVRRNFIYLIDQCTSVGGEFSLQYYGLKEFL